jgi:hypothetical protein
MGVSSPSSSTITDEIWVCPVNPDGTMGSWTLQTERLPAARYNVNLVAVNDTIFAVGGRDGTGASQDNVWRATFDSGTGTVGAWSSVDLPLPEGIRYHDVDYSPITRRLYAVSLRTGSGVTNQAYISSDLFPPPITGVEEWTLYR